MQIPEIIKKAGGPTRIAEATGGKPSVWAVYKWAQNGIPNRHWAIVMELAGVTAEQIHEANRAAEEITRASSEAA